MDLKEYLRLTERMQWERLSRLHARAVEFLSTPQDPYMEKLLGQYYRDAKASAERVYPILKSL